MSASRRRVLVIALAALALLNLVVYGAFSLPRSLQERAIATRTEVLKQELAREQRLLEDLRERAEAIQANQRDTRRFYRERVEARQVSLVPILQHIEALASEQGLRVGDQRYAREQVKNAALERFEITMPVTGSYRQLVQLVGKLEESSYLLTLDEVKVRGAADAGQAQLDLVLSCYFGKGSGEKP